ncbi:MAG TPA: A/G-specific adenine glycosylase [Mycobacterium sp.]
MDADLLLNFFTERGRDLPWREPSATPWAVLVSEIMLQQTPVNRVLPVYRQWMTRWPEPAALAADSPADAIRMWGRLGYPRRALRLHAAATVIAAEYAGEVPDTVENLLLLPGIGEYTAGAVAAFAFRRRTPVVDTNVRRVLSRVVRGVDEPRQPATAADRADMATLLPAEPETAARFSAAVMELGALVCSARSPDCPSCPLADRCRWRLAGSQLGLPRRAVQAWHGTDRQVRGRIMAALRASHRPVPDGALAELSTDTGQGHRCLASLLVDGLAVRVGAGHIALPD